MIIKLKSIDDLMSLMLVILEKILNNKRIRSDLNNGKTPVAVNIIAANIPINNNKALLLSIACLLLVEEIE